MDVVFSFYCNNNFNSSYPVFKVILDDSLFE